ncbi:hypothetical protein SEA_BRUTONGASTER_96 [Gordonia phage BrutonGaster]|uniref:Uncharacterized protein n=1 Tax=Gordonia phage BrutonGaster TaxID=2530116 RepID=A0A482JHR7_9CAUD|nr:hypothetical protein HOV26_gp086 [Gordonia phage BrutonGaster]QBP33311.1 hypothetical protein SEA_BRUTONGASTER_96 [Gordonia phage BrutonGaster]
MEPHVEAMGEVAAEMLEKVVDYVFTEVCEAAGIAYDKNNPKMLDELVEKIEDLREKAWRLEELER